MATPIVSPLRTVSSLDETLSLHSTHHALRAPLQETSIGSYRKMVVDLERPQIPHSLPLASFRKMVVRLERPQIPHTLPLASFGAFWSTAIGATGFAWLPSLAGHHLSYIRRRSSLL